MKIRLAKLGDQDRVFELLIELRKSVSNIADFKVSRNSPNLYKSLIKREDFKIYLLEDNDEIAGLATLQTMPKIDKGEYRGYIEDLVISKDFQRKGLGSFLLSQIFKLCKKEGINTIWLNCGRQLYGSQNFYERNGGTFTDYVYKFKLD